MDLDPLEAKRAQNREACRRYRQSAGGRAKRQAYEKTDACKKYRAGYGRTAARLEYKAIWNKTEKARAWRRAWDAKRLENKTRPSSAFLMTELFKNGTYNAVQALVPRGLPSDVRDDMIMEIVLSLLEGTHTLETAKKSIWSFTPPHYRDRFRTMSLEAPIPGTDSLRLIDVIPDTKEGEE